MNKKSKGFTIIELLVVVAIIAVLASIVLVNVTSYISKGKDSAAKGNLATLLTNGAAFYDSTGAYTNFTTSTTTPKTVTADCAGNSGFSGPCNALLNAGYTSITFTCAGTSCTNTATAWCAMVTLKTSPGNTYCVDSSGAKLDKAGGTCAAGVCG